MIDGIIFDADGVLLDSMRIWATLGEKYLQTKGMEAEAGLGGILHTMSLEESSAYLKNKYDLSESAEKIKAEMLLLIENFYSNEVRAKCGVSGFLERMRQAGVPMGIATSGDGVLLMRALERLNFDGYFSAVLTCSELKTTKRSGGIYLKTVEALGTDVKRTAVFEDMLCGVVSAKNVGFMTIAVEDDYSADDKVKIRETADLYIRDFDDIILERWLRTI